MREAARKGLALRMEADRKKPWLRSQTPSPPGINVQLTELKVFAKRQHVYVKKPDVLCRSIGTLLRFDGDAERTS